MGRPLNLTDKEIVEWEQFIHAESEKAANEIYVKRCLRLDEYALAHIDEYEPCIQDCIRNYGGRCLYRSSVVFERSDKVIADILRGKKINTAVEIGYYNGVCSLVMARYCDTIHSFDIADGPLADAICPPNVTRHVIKSESEKHDILSGLDFQFAFVDGDHVNCTGSDFNAVKKCGLVLFDEVKSTQPNCYNFVSALKNIEYIPTQFALWRKG